ncbi:HD domain-containing protein, partial [bacterium]
MDRLKHLITRNFELAIVVVLVGATAFAVLVAANKLAFLNVFYLPVLVASYFLGRKHGMLVALAAVLMVGLYSILNPSIFGSAAGEIPQLNVVLWGGFTILTAYVVGTLYEVKTVAVNDLRQAYKGILEILAKFIDAVDQYTNEHSMRVSNIAAGIASELKLARNEIDNVRVAGLLHDIGKIDLSLDVLRKASSLDESEWEHIRTHVAKGTAILQPVGGMLRDVVPIVECHHERWDGTGYLGMKGAEIPLGARILSVADAYDSMVCDRPYRT